jgi:hypothetical protein
MKKIYFSFIGDCMGSLAGEFTEERNLVDDGNNTYHYDGSYGDGISHLDGYIPKAGELLYSACFDNLLGYRRQIRIHNYPNPKLVVVVSVHETHSKRTTYYYICKRDSFEGNPFAPVTTFNVSILY